MNIELFMHFCNYYLADHKELLEWLATHETLEQLVSDKRPQKALVVQLLEHNMALCLSDGDFQGALGLQSMIDEMFPFELRSNAHKSNVTKG